MNRAEYILSTLAEECAEVGQRVSKALRFGLHEIQPGQPLTNAERIAEELTDVLALAQMAVEAGLLSNISNGLLAMRDKQMRVERMMVYSRKVGALADG